MSFLDRFRSGSHSHDHVDPDPSIRLSYEAEDRASLTLDLDDVPTRLVVERAGEEPNGAFWEGVVHYAAPHIFRHLNFESEGRAFVVEGERADLREIRDILRPFVTDEAEMTALLERAHANNIVLGRYGR
nr:Imm51 family immunity protein [Flaviflexus huanghaiensis]